MHSVAAGVGAARLIEGEVRVSVLDYGILIYRLDNGILVSVHTYINMMIWNSWIFRKKCGLSQFTVLVCAVCDALENHHTET